MILRSKEQLSNHFCSFFNSENFKRASFHTYREWKYLASIHSALLITWTPASYLMKMSGGKHITWWTNVLYYEIVIAAPVNKACPHCSFQHNKSPERCSALIVTLILHKN